MSIRAAGRAGRAGSPRGRSGASDAMVKVMVGLTVSGGDCEQHRQGPEAGAMKRLRRMSETTPGRPGPASERTRGRAGPLCEGNRPAHEREEKRARAPCLRVRTTVIGSSANFDKF